MRVLKCVARGKYSIAAEGDISIVEGDICFLKLPLRGNWETDWVQGWNERTREFGDLPGNFMQAVEEVEIDEEEWIRPQDVIEPVRRPWRMSFRVICGRPEDDIELEDDAVDRRRRTKTSRFGPVIRMLRRRRRSSPEPVRSCQLRRRRRSSQDELRGSTSSTKLMNRNPLVSPEPQESRYTRRDNLSLESPPANVMYVTERRVREEMEEMVYEMEYMEMSFPERMWMVKMDMKKMREEMVETVMSFPERMKMIQMDMMRMKEEMMVIVERSASKEKLPKYILPLELVEIDGKAQTLQCRDVGITLDIPEGATEKLISLKCKVWTSTEICPLLANGDTLVSSVVQLETIPQTAELKKPVMTYLSHCGAVSGGNPSEGQVQPSHREYFEIVVKHCNSEKLASEEKVESTTWQNIPFVHVIKQEEHDDAGLPKNVSLPAIKFYLPNCCSGTFAVISQPKRQAFDVDEKGKNVEVLKIPWPIVNLSFPPDCISESYNFIIQAWPVHDQIVSKPIVTDKSSLDQAQAKTEEYFFSPILEVITQKEMTFLHPVKITSFFSSLTLPWLNIAIGEKVPLQNVGCLFTRKGNESDAKWEADSDMVTEASVTVEAFGILLEFQTNHFSKFSFSISKKPKDFIVTLASRLFKRTPVHMVMWSLIETDKILNQVIAPRNLKDKLDSKFGVEGTNSQHDVYDGEYIHFKIKLADNTEIDKNEPWKIRFRTEYETNAPVKLSKDQECNGSVRFNSKKNKQEILGIARISKRVEKNTNGVEVLQYLWDPPLDWERNAHIVLVNGHHRLFRDRRPVDENLQVVKENFPENKLNDLRNRLRVGEPDLVGIEEDERTVEERVSEVLDRWLLSIQNDETIEDKNVGMKKLMKSLYDLHEYDILVELLNRHFPLRR